VLPIALGVAVAPLVERPDVLIGDNGRLVVVRDGDGKFSGLTSRFSNYELSQWLVRDGDSREAWEVGIEGALSCDQVDCVGRVKGVVIAITRRAASLQEDCLRADILVMRVEVRPGCDKPGLIVVQVRSSRQGTLAILIGDDGSIDSTSVTDFQGQRLWSRQVR